MHPIIVVAEQWLKPQVMLLEQLEGCPLNSAQELPEIRCRDAPCRLTLLCVQDDEKKACQCGTHQITICRPPYRTASCTAAEERAGLVPLDCGTHQTSREIAWVDKNPQALACRDLTSMQFGHDVACIGTQKLYGSSEEKSISLMEVGVAVQSQLTQRAVEVVNRVFPTSLVMLEQRILVSTFKFNKPVDIVIGGCYSIAIEVDGSQHFEESKQYMGTTLEVQRRIDAEFEALCKQNGVRLVRLHYADDHSWQRVLCLAKHVVDKASATSSTCHVDLRTPSYQNVQRV